jgi:ubiquinone/menaquinone biosynthesis C-methylase UbiE
MSGESRSHDGLKDAFAEKWRRLDARERKFYAPGRPATQKQWIFRQYWDFIERRLPPRPGGLRCLEVGAGRGTTSLYLTQAGHRCVLVDTSPEALAMASRNFESEGMKADFLQSAAEALGVRSASVDVVVTLGLLEHFEDVRPPLAEMARVLTPDGVLFSLNIPGKVVSANLVSRPYNLAMIQLRRLARLRTTLERWRHGDYHREYRNRLSPDAYRAAALAAGFRQVTCVGVNPVPTFQPVPVSVDRALAGLYDGFLRVRRSALGYREPFVTTYGWGRDHFLVAKK